MLNRRLPWLAGLSLAVMILPGCTSTGCRSCERKTPIFGGGSQPPVYTAGPRSYQNTTATPNNAMASGRPSYGTMTPPGNAPAMNGGDTGHVVPARSTAQYNFPPASPTSQVRTSDPMPNIAMPQVNMPPEVLPPTSPVPPNPLPASTAFPPDQGKLVPPQVPDLPMSGPPGPPGRP